MTASCAVVGGGIAGLSCAARLAGRGFPVTVFDKGRRPGGRVATRRTPFGSFDHGAQYVTADDADVRAWLAACEAAGAAARWDGVFAAGSGGRLERRGDGVQRWVGVPGMSALAAHLATGLAVRCQQRIGRVARRGGVWQLLGEDGLTVAEADIVVIAVPAPQAVDLLQDSPRLAGRAAEAILQPCWAMMLAYAAPLPLPFDGIFVNGGPLAWISRNAAKPSRTGADAWVLHASPDWSRDHLEDDPAAVGAALQRAFAEAAGVEAPAPRLGTVHRWRYARVTTPLGTPCLFADDLGIGACGDWCLGSTVEAALRSGRMMAETIIANRGPALVEPTGRRATGGAGGA